MDVEKIEKITCACGCGKLFRPKRPWQLFKTDRCRMRYWNRLRAARVVRNRKDANGTA